MPTLSENQIGEWICRRLGSNVVGVELSQDHIDDAINDAKIWWQSFVGQAKSVVFTLTGGTEYLGSLIASDIDSVVDVNFEINGEIFANLFAWADVEIDPFTWVYDGHGGYSELIQYMQYREMAKQTISSDRTWEWDRSRQTLIISPRPDAGSKIMVTYLSKNVDVTYLQNEEMFVFRNYALSQAMKMLAMIRMKFSDKPSATGSFSMDGDAMYANGEALEKDMEERMMSLALPVGFFAE